MTKIIFCAMLVFSCQNEVNESVTSDSTLIENQCNDEIETEKDGHFVLTLSLNECFKNVKQTIFIESADKVRNNTLFAIGAEFDYEYKNERFNEIRLENFEVKRLIGNKMKIIKIEYLGLDDEDSSQHNVQIVVDEENGTSSRNFKLKVTNFKTADKLEIGLAYKEEYDSLLNFHEDKKFIGPRICTNYIGSLDANQ